MSVLSGKKGGMKQYRVWVWRRAPAPSLGMLVPTKDSLSILPKNRLLTWRNVCRSLPHLEQADIRLGLKNKDIAKFLQCGQWNLSFPRLFLQDPEKKIFQPKDKKMFCTVLINFLVLISGCRTSDLLWFDPHHMYFLQVYSLIAKLKSDHSVPQVKSYVFCSHSLLRVVSAESFHLNGIKRHFFLSFLWKPSKCLSFFSLSLKNKNRALCRKLFSNLFFECLPSKVCSLGSLVFVFLSRKWLEVPLKCPMNFSPYSRHWDEACANYPVLHHRKCPPLPLTIP